MAGVKLPDLHLLTWAHDIACGRVATGEKQIMILVGMYSLWSQRNQRRHGGQPILVKNAVQWAVDMAFDLWHMSSRLEEPTTQHVSESHGHRWAKPPAGWMKCNVDGAFYERQWQGASGWALRDDSGAFLRGGAKWYNHCLDARSMEAMACRDGLVVARQLGLWKVWLESDCQELIKLWHKGDKQRSNILPIVSAIKP